MDGYCASPDPASHAAPGQFETIIVRVAVARSESAPIVVATQQEMTRKYVKKLLSY